MSEALNEEFFTSILESNKDAVRATVRDALLEGLKRKFEWEIPEAVNKAVQEFITDEVIPQIKAELQANKDVFVDAATEMAKAAPVEISKAMQAKLAENLTHSWTLRNVVKACFE